MLINDIHVPHDNIAEFSKNFAEAVQICKDRKIQEIVIGGDLWQSRSSQPLNTLMAVRDAILSATTAGIYVTIAEGNHCKVDQESVLGYSHIFSGYKNVEVVDDYSVIELDPGVLLFVMSYFPEDGSFPARLADIEATLSPDDYNMLYIHEGINGALATPAAHELPTHIFRQFNAVLVGHYHDRCKIKGTNIEYIGASRQHSFGEDEEKGYTIVYNDGSYEFVKNQVNVRYKTISMTTKDAASLTEEMAESIKHGGQYKIRAKIHGQSKDIVNIDKQQLINAGITKIEISATDSVATSNVSAKALEQRYDKSEIKTEYINFCATKGINQSLGLAYLDKITD